MAANALVSVLSHPFLTLSVNMVTQPALKGSYWCELFFHSFVSHKFTLAQVQRLRQTGGQWRSAQFVSRRQVSIN